jgi:Transglutaminase-like superfamily/Coenzyme PQQ synthesis protein D (PqqD)
MIERPSKAAGAAPVLVSRKRNSNAPDNMRFTIAPHVRSSCQQDQIVILDTNAGALYLCHGAAVKMWRGLVAGQDSDAISADVSRENGAPPDEAQRALESFLDQLRARKLLVDDSGRRLPRRALVLACAILELIRYDIQLAIFGFRSVHSGLEQRPCTPHRSSTDSELTTRVVDAMSMASSLYWRPVKCLQRSTATARVLRGFGIPAQLVIGYRARPFLSHAWVEVEGRVVNDSQALAQRLTVLDRV